MERFEAAAHMWAIACARAPDLQLCNTHTTGRTRYRSVVRCGARDNQRTPTVAPKTAGAQTVSQIKVERSVSSSGLAALRARD